MPKAGREEGKTPDNPLGPGTYNISRDIVGKERGTFGRDKRKMGDELGDPDLMALGPGAYTLEEDTFKKDNGRGFSIVGKPRAQSATPGSKLGPGQYYRNSGALNNEVYSFGKGKRAGLTYNENNKVGPGQYGSMRDKSFGSKGISFGKSTREGKGQGSGVGPGQYCAQKSKAIRPVTSVGTFGTAERKIGDRLRETGCAKNLGPGYYSVKDNQNNGWSFGKQDRGANEGKFNNPMGPGSYTVKSEFSKRGGLIGTSSRNPTDKSTKPPGFYSIPATVPDAPKYLLPPKNERKIHI